MTVRVALTRAAGGNDELARLLGDSADIETVEAPLIRIEPLPGPEIDAAGYDWVVLTSRGGADLFFARLKGACPPVAVVGPGTAAAVRAHGLEPALVATRSTQEGLLAELPRPAGRVLFAGAEDARPVLADALGADVLVLYRTVAVPPDSFPAVDLVVLASASAARSFARAGARSPCVSIGPVTTEAARAAGLEVIREAETHDLEGLVRAVKLAASGVRSSLS